MPGLPMPFCAPSMTAVLADSTAAPRRTSSATPGATRPMVSTAIAEATSPAAWPPMPSHTAKTGARKRKESSLWARTKPTSERAPHEMNWLAPVTTSESLRPSTGISWRPGALTGAGAGAGSMSWGSGCGCGSGEAAWAGAGAAARSAPAAAAKSASGEAAGCAENSASTMGTASSTCADVVWTSSGLIRGSPS